MEKYFELKKNGTSIKQELIAAFVTFCSMVYILIVIANMYTNPLGNGENPLGIPFGAIYVGIALSAVVGCILMGLIAKLPIAFASGLGLNAFFIYTVCLSLGFSYENSLVIILAEGLIFLILTLTGGIKKIYESIPDNIRFAISAGIGLFIAYLGLLNSGIIVAHKSTGLALNSFNILHTPLEQFFPALVSIFSLFVIAVLSKRKIKGAIFWGIFSGVILYYISILFLPNLNQNINIETINPIISFKEFFEYSFCKVFTSGLDFSNYIAKYGFENFLINIITTTISFCLVNIFDNIGSLQAVCVYGNMLKDNEIPNFNKAMTASSIATIAGSAIGVSTISTYVESATGVGEGGRTGLTAVFVGIFFFFAAFFSPIAQFVPVCATSSVLIFIGSLMVSAVKNIDWNSIEKTLPAFLTICMMPFTCNISNGIAFGLISYVIIKAFTGKIKEIKITTWIIVLLFLTMLLLSH